MEKSQIQKIYGEYRDYNLFSKIKNEQDAYWLGVMYSDGWVRSDRNSIGLGSIDIDLINKFQKYTECPNKILKKKKDYNVGRKFADGHLIQSSKEFYVLEFSSKTTKENLKNLGCLPAKSKILSCPTSEQVPDSLFLDFLRGYVDGDGWVVWNEKKKRYSFGFVGTENFIRQACERAKIINYGKIRKKTGEEQYEFYVSKKILIKKILEKLYKGSTVFLKRKYEIFLQSLGVVSQNCEEL